MPGNDRENAECLDIISSPSSLLRAAPPAPCPLAGEGRLCDSCTGDSSRLEQGSSSSPLSSSAPSAHSPGRCQGEPEFGQIQGNAHRRVARGVRGGTWKWDVVERKGERGRRWMGVQLGGRLGNGTERGVLNPAEGGLC